MKNEQDVDPKKKESTEEEEPEYIQRMRYQAFLTMYKQIQRHKAMKMEASNG